MKLKGISLKKRDVYGYCEGMNYGKRLIRRHGVFSSW
jgi:hypothetical protein